MFGEDRVKLRQFQVFLGHHRISSFPVNLQSWVAPQNPEFIARVVKVRAFIEELHRFCQCQKAVRKSRRDIDLVLQFRRKPQRGPLAEVRRTARSVPGVYGQRV